MLEFTSTPPLFWRLSSLLASLYRSASSLVCILYFSRIIQVLKPNCSATFRNPELCKHLISSWLFNVCVLAISQVCTDARSSIYRVHSLFIIVLDIKCNITTQYLFSLPCHLLHHSHLLYLSQPLQACPLTPHACKVQLIQGFYSGPTIAVQIAVGTKYLVVS